MLNASQNYITIDLNCNKYIQDKVFVNNYKQDKSANSTFISPKNTFHYYNNNSEILYNLDAPRCRILRLAKETIYRFILDFLSLMRHNCTLIIKMDF